MFANSHVALIYGSAGTGKSTLINNKENIAICIIVPFRKELCDRIILTIPDGNLPTHNVEDSTEIIKKLQELASSGVSQYTASVDSWISRR